MEETNQNTMDIVESGLDEMKPSKYGSNPFEVFTNEKSKDILYSDLSMADNLQTAFRDDSFIYQGGQLIYNKMEDNSVVKDENFTTDIKSEIVKNSGLKKDLQETVINRAKNEEHLLELLTEAKEHERRLDALDETTLGGFFYRGAAITSDLIPLLAAAPVTIGGRIALASSPVRRFLTGATYDGLVELSKREMSERDRTTLELVVAPLLGGAANAAFGKGYSVPKELKERATDMIRMNTNMSKEDVKELDSLLKNEKVEEANALVKAKMKQGREEVVASEDLIAMVDLKNKTLGMTESAYNKLRGDLSFLLEHSNSESMAKLARHYFEDPLLKNNTKDVLYGSRTAVELKETLLGDAQREFNALAKDWRQAFVESGQKKDFGTNVNGLLETFSEGRESLYHYAGKLHLLRSNNIRNMRRDDLALKWITDELETNMKFTRATAEEMGKKMMKATENVAMKHHDTLTQFGAIKFADGSIKQDKFYATNVYRKGSFEELIAQGFKSQDISDYMTRSYINGLIKNAREAGNNVRAAKLKELTTKINGKNEDFDNLQLAMLRFIKSVTKSSVGARRLRVDKLREDDLDDFIEEAFKDNPDMLELIKNLKEETDEAVKDGFGKEEVVFQKRRKAFDRSYVKEYANGEISFDNFLETNLDAIYTQYAKKMSGRVSLEQTKGKTAYTPDGNEIKEFKLNTEEEIEAFFKKAQAEINNKNISPNKKESEIERIRHTLLQMMGEPTIDKPDSMTHQVVDILNNMTVGLKLGAGALPMIAEYTNMAMKFGVREFLSNFQVGKDIQKIMTTGKVDDNLAKEMYEFLEIGKELGEGFAGIRQEANMNPFSTANIATGNTYNTPMENALNTAHKFSMKFASATLLMSGMKPLHTFGQAAFGATIVNQFFKRNIGVTKDLDKFFKKEMNMSDEMFDRVLSQFRKHGKVDTINNKAKVNKANFAKWDDEEAYFAFRHGTKRVLDTYMQRGHLGDEFGATVGGRLLSDTFYGRMFLNLKNYMIVSYTKQLGRMAYDMDRKQQLTMAAQTVAVTSLVYAQAIVNNLGNEEKTKEALEIGNVAKNVLNKLSFGSYMPMSYGFGEAMLTGSSGYSNTLPVWFQNQFPQFATIKDIAGIARTPYNLATGNFAKVGKDAVALIPNHPAVQPFRNKAKTAFEDSIRLDRNAELREKASEERYEDLKEQLGY